jgi:hypothetical protein
MLVLLDSVTLSSFSGKVFAYFMAEGATVSLIFRKQIELITCYLPVLYRCLKYLYANGNCFENFVTVHLVCMETMIAMKFQLNISVGDNGY